MGTTGSVSHTDERFLHEKYVMNVRPESRNAVLAGSLRNENYRHRPGRHVDIWKAINPPNETLIPKTSVYKPSFVTRHFLIRPGVPHTRKQNKI